MANGKEFTLTKPSAAASKGRTYALYCAVGVDVREAGLTNKQAHNYLNDANSGKAYHVRKALLALDGSRAGKQDVAKEHRSDPKPSKTAKKAKSKDNGDPTLAELLELLKQRPELIKALAGETEDEDDEDAEEKELPETKAKKRAATPKPKAAKAKPKTAKEDDLAISDEDLLSFIESAVSRAAG